MTKTYYESVLERLNNGELICEIELYTPQTFLSINEKRQYFLYHLKFFEEFGDISFVLINWGHKWGDMIQVEAISRKYKFYAPRYILPSQIKSVHFLYPVKSL